MITISQNSDVFVATKPVDFRKGINGLCGICRQQFNQDPSSGAYFVFTNKRKKALKIIYFDGSGYWLFVKRISSGRLPWWPKGKELSKEDARVVMTLALGGNPQSAEFGKDWKKLL